MSDAILKLVRPDLLTLTPYSSARLEQSEGRVWLNANENPWDSEELWNRYPEPQPQEILQKMSEIYQVSPEQLIVMRGSDEGIDLLIRLFCVASQDAIMITPPTFGMYKVNASIQNAAVVKVPLLREKDFALDSKSILQQWQPHIKIIFICSPNNPTGNVIPAEQILQLCQTFKDRAIIAVDEAYIEFANAPSLASHIQQYDNLVILRTLSKAYGLAGVRCGFVLAIPAIIRLLKMIIPPYPLPVPIINIVKKTLSEEKLLLMQQQISILKQQRDYLLKELPALPEFRRVWPSEGNFILCEVDDVAAIMQRCHRQGIVIRDRSQDYNLENCIRITVGKPEENQFLLQVLKHAS